MSKKRGNKVSESDKVGELAHTRTRPTFRPEWTLCPACEKMLKDYLTTCNHRGFHIMLLHDKLVKMVQPDHRLPSD